MRILVLTSLYPNPLQPNRATFNRQQFQALAAEHEVQVIAPIAWTDEWSHRRKSAGMSRQLLCDGLVVHHPRYVFTPKIFRSQYGAFFVRSVHRCFDDVVRSLRPDVVLGCWAYPDGWAAVRLARQASMPVALKVHGSDILLLNEHPARRQRTADALAGADAVITVSRHLAAQAVVLGADPDRVSVVYNGVDTSLFHPGPKNADKAILGYASASPLIVFAGNLVLVKGVDILLDALALIARGGQSFHCALIGEGPLRNDLRSRAVKLGLADQVRFVGARPLKELASWYRAADLVVLPSRSEGVPNVLLEATACGTPFIASRVGGITEIAPADALVEAGNAAALAERISRFLADGGPIIEPPFRAGSWIDSSRALAAVLQGILEDAKGQKKRAA